MKWFIKDWWKYILDDSRCYDKYAGYDEIIPYKIVHELEEWDSKIIDRIFRFVSYIYRCQCRARNHPYGIHWYSWGLEPDMHCMGCGEDLG